MWASAPRVCHCTYHDRSYSSHHDKGFGARTENHWLVTRWLLWGVALLHNCEGNRHKPCFARMRACPFFILCPLCARHRVRLRTAEEWQPVPAAEMMALHASRTLFAPDTSNPTLSDRSISAHSCGRLLSLRRQCWWLPVRCVGSRAVPSTSAPRVCSFARFSGLPMHLPVMSVLWFAAGSSAGCLLLVLQC